MPEGLLCRQVIERVGLLPVSCQLGSDHKSQAHDSLEGKALRQASGPGGDSQNSPLQQSQQTELDGAVEA